MKVFLSHSTRDRPFVEALATRMRTEGFTPWHCERDIGAGSNWAQEVGHGLADADLALLIWSSDAAISEATRREWSSAFDREISEHRLRLGVLRLDDEKLPELLRSKQFIDARQDRERGIASTLDWLRARRDSGRRAGGLAPVYLPDYHPESYTARPTYLGRIRDALVDQAGGFLLCGEPGVGKSILSLEFAWSAQRHFDAVVYQICGRRDVDAIVGEIADKLRDQLDGDVIQLPPDKKREAVKQWLKQRRALLVLDDLWPESAAAQDLYPGPPVSALFTSRQRSLPGLPKKQILAIEGFTDAEAEQVFKEYLGTEEAENHRKALLQFAERVERLPIAITIGVQMLRAQAGPLDGAAGKLLDRLTDVNVLFDSAIESQGEQERQLMRASAVCSQEGFWLPLAVETAGLTDGEGESARDKLVNASMLRMLDRDRQRFGMHALLRGRLRKDDEEIERLRVTHVAALERRFKDHETTWRECRECLDEIIPAAGFLWSRNEISR